jgi:hypothetical protein
VSRFLTNKLRLTVNEAKSAVARPEGLEVLGEAPVSSKPGEGALDHPAARQDDHDAVALGDVSLRLGHRLGRQRRAPDAGRRSLRAIQDRDRAGPVLDRIRRRFPRLELISADGGYNAWQVEAPAAKVPRLRKEIVERSDAMRGFVAFEALRQPVEPGARVFLQIEQGGHRCGPTTRAWSLRPFTCLPAS